MKKIALTTLILLLTGISFAINENKKISLKEAIKITLEANPRVKIEQLNVEASKNNIKNATALQNPSIYTFQNMGQTGKTEPQQIGASYVIEILKRGKRKNLQISNSIATLNNQKFQEQLLIFNVRKAYIELLLKKSNLKVLTEQQELAKDLLKTLENEEKKGKIPKTEVIQAKIAYNRSVMYTNIAKSNVISAQNLLNSTMNTKELNYDTKEDYLNGEYEDLSTISPTNNKIDFERIKDFALENRFDLKKAAQEVESAKNNLKVTKSKLIPDLEITGGYGYQTKGYNDANKNEHGAFAGVSLTNIPLINQYKPEIKNAEIEIEKAQLKYEDIKIDVIRDLTDAWEKFTIARENLNFYNDELLKNSFELLSASRESYKNKEIDLTSYIVSKKLYLELILGYQEALGDYYISYAELMCQMNVVSLQDTFDDL